MQGFGESMFHMEESTHAKAFRREQFGVFEWQREGQFG